MPKKDTFKLAAALLMLMVAGVFLFRFVLNEQAGGEKAFFYDLSEKKLFKAARTAVPPIRGINDSIEDGVRAMVISVTGNPADKSSWKIAYLERYSPELKQQMEQAQATGDPPPMGRGLAQMHRFVRRLETDEWFSLATPEGEAIVNGWIALGTNGTTPVVCTP